MKIKNSFLTFYQEEMVDLRLYQAGSENCLPLKHYGPFARNHYLFHFIHSGSGHFETYDSRDNFLSFELEKYEGFFSAPGQVATYVASKNSPWSYSWIEIDGIHANRLFNTVGLSQDQPIYRSKNEVIGQSIERKIAAISHIDVKDTSAALGHLYHLMDFLEKGSQIKGNLLYAKRENDYVRNAILFIETYYKNDITIQDIADYCRLNAIYLGKIFKSVTGKGLKSFMIDIRLTKSMDLLRTTSLSIKEVSEAVGYQNQLHFSRSFRSRFSMSPSEWRKQNIILSTKETSF